LPLVTVLTRSGGKGTMINTESITQNPVHQGLMPMLRIWAHSIGWTIVLSTLLAVLFALALHGCAAH
ncbi:MAG TPA: hypothetical protein VE133_17250, partial [Candidatus Sulfotelmatobacter sp.]|nr:hypothetical protein [Candidatus Sulfotelmatobacter sp.]